MSVTDPVAGRSTFFREGGASEADIAFLTRYWDDLSDHDLSVVPASERVAAALAHLAFAATREQQTHITRVLVGGAQGGLVVQVASVDVPLLVDSLMNEMSRLGVRVILAVHPVLRLQGSGWSLIRLEVDASAAGLDADQIGAAAHQVLTRVHHVARDWPAMRERAHGLAATLASSSDPASEEGRRLLEWLAADNFVFVGYHSLGLDGAGTLGLDAGVDLTWSAESGAPVQWLKSTIRSPIHRDDFLDVIRVRADGGEHVFTGLAAATFVTSSVHEVPVLDAKAAAVLQQLEADPSSHAGKACALLLERFPREELLVAPAADVARTLSEVYRQSQRRRPIVFLHLHEDTLRLSCLLYIPRDWYSTQLRTALQELISAAAGTAEVDFTVNMNDRQLAQVHFTVVATRRPSPDALAQLQQQLMGLARPWRDSLRERLARDELVPADLLGRWADAFDFTYQASHSVERAAAEVAALQAISTADLNAVSVLALDVVDPQRRTLHLVGSSKQPLSVLLPLLHSLGVQVIDEQSWAVDRPGLGTGWLIELGVSSQTWGSAPQESRRFTDALERLAAGDAVADGLNRLVLRAGLTWRQVEILRAYVKYYRQLDARLTPAYIESLLEAHADHTREVLAIFALRFDPQRLGDVEQRRRDSTERAAALSRQLDLIESGDADRVLRTLLCVVMATVRTNAFSSLPRPALAFKISSRDVPAAPTPRPQSEIWVYSTDFEGVHLRFGKVARGGLRWSDRPDDFRTEILGLAKAQTLKNAVIVPAGAKGGFVITSERRASPTSPEAGPDGLTCYQRYISVLLDVVDNRAPRTSSDAITYDVDDPYLVVAADKGTSRFSDVANTVALDRGFWLGDAFASGGSQGYDHKALAITARGVWESVKRHLWRLGLDPERDPVTVAGIGDMNGDVFGNGLLLSHTVKLVAAFDHRHIFIDPTPDPDASWAERKRLFDQPTSSWADYDPSLISPGGGVFRRSLKSVDLGPEAAAVLGLGSHSATLTPNQIIAAVLKAPVDLLWNGGVGTYVKASTEPHTAAADRANDLVRIDANQLHARVVAEGGNLGLTARGRVEAARAGVLLNTDAVDNSAGVDCSDHEVNVKILLDRAVADDRLDRTARNDLLRSMSDSVCRSVLRTNYRQNLLLHNEGASATEMLPVHARMIKDLELHHGLDRQLEVLPDDEELAGQAGQRVDLSTPELAVLMGYAKLTLKAALTAPSISDDPFADQWLFDYFPAALHRRFASEISTHRLRPQLIATVLANDIINTGGVSFVFRAVEDTEAEVADVVRAYAAAREIFDVPELLAGLAELDKQLDPDTHAALYVEVRRLLDRVVRWFLLRQPRNLRVDELVETYAPRLAPMLGTLPDRLLGEEAAEVRAQVDRLQAKGLPNPLARRLASLLYEFRLLDIVELAQRVTGEDDRVTTVYFNLSERYGVARVLRQIADLPRRNRWETLVRSSLRADLEQAIASLSEQVLPRLDGGDVCGASATAASASWEAEAGPEFTRAAAALTDVAHLSDVDFAALSAVIRLFRQAIVRRGRE